MAEPSLGWNILTLSLAILVEDFGDHLGCNAQLGEEFRSRDDSGIATSDEQKSAKFTECNSPCPTEEERQ